MAGLLSEEVDLFMTNFSEIKPLLPGTLHPKLQSQDYHVTSSQSMKLITPTHCRLPASH